MKLTGKVKFGILAAGLAVILIMLAAILSLSLKQNEMIMRSTYLSAEGYLESIVLTRRWNAHYGGVYVLKKEAIKSLPGKPGYHHSGWGGLYEKESCTDDP
jgi:hypothetical protein